MVCKSSPWRRWGAPPLALLASGYRLRGNVRTVSNNLRYSSFLDCYRFNTFDQFCFKDLAVLGGAKYLTWTAGLDALNPSIPVAELTAHNAKQTNYSPDRDAFVALLRSAVSSIAGADTGDGIGASTMEL